MKIGIDARMYGKAQSGIGNYIKQLTDNLFQIDSENDYYLFLLEPIFSQYKPISEKVHKIKVHSHWYSLSEQTKFLFDLLKYNLDLVHFPHFNAPIFYPKKRITTIHDITPFFFPGHKQKSWLRKKSYQLTIKTSLKKSAKIIVDSHFTKNDLIRYFKIKPEKIEVIYLGIEPQFKISENYDKIKELRQKYNLHKPYIFFVSVWRNHKNIAGLIKAFELLKEQHGFDGQLVIGGQEDPNYLQIREAIKNSKFKTDIVTPGFISDEELPLFYNAADLFVIPSFYEGFGLIGLEALACGVPVVSSKTTSLPEILGNAALYFDPQNIEEMAKIMKTALTDLKLRENLKQKGFVQLKKYSWRECAQKTLTLYKNILVNKL